MNTNTPCETPYIGRFAPSPTGPLHIGSLMTALASFLDARANQGNWLVRMEDLDSPREMPGAADSILSALDAHGLHWDGPIHYQSQRNAVYEESVKNLLQQRKAFYCTCSRTEVREQSLNGAYPGTCRQCHTPPLSPFAVRATVNDLPIKFNDRIQGPQTNNLQQSFGDYIIKRKEGLYAYHLAVVIDDAEQNVTHILRGCDLLDSTFCHIHLQHQLGFTTPDYGHLPVITNAQGQKLSKQTFAPALTTEQSQANLFYCLDKLGQQPPTDLTNASVPTILHWGIENWQQRKIPHKRSIPE